MLFYPKKPKNYVDGEMPIYVRITVNGIPREMSTGKYCHPNNWNPRISRVDGKKENVRLVNNYLKTIEDKIEQAHIDLVSSGETFTTDILKNRFMGIDEKPRTLVNVIQDHNDKIEALIGKGFSKGTLTKYNTTLKHVKSFLVYKYKAEDLPVEKVDNYFITEFDFYLRSRCGCQNNAAVKHLKNLGKVIRICLANRWISFDPFTSHKNTITKTQQVILTQEDITAIWEKDMAIERLRLVRDAFIFCCYTGLSFIDLVELKKSEVVNGVDGSLWIIKKRHKTGIPCNVPLLPVALEIFNRYCNHPLCADTDRAFPMNSNQKMNAYLKEVADLSGVEKHLTFKVARVAFATTVTMGNGIPIESVSKMLGHTNIKTTQIYAKIMDNKVSMDMEVLRKIYASK
jgi:site-specific recombinase XerD